MPQVALTQEQILTYVDAAIVVLEAETGRMATTDEIQEYLQVQFGIKEPLERIAEASALVYEIRLKAEIEE